MDVRLHGWVSTTRYSRSLYQGTLSREQVKFYSPHRLTHTKTTTTKHIMVSSVFTLVSCAVSTVCMVLAIATAALPDAWFSFTFAHGIVGHPEAEAAVECGLWDCRVSGSDESSPSHDFDCNWMNAVVKAWRGEVIVVAVFSLVAGGLYLLAMLKPSAAHGMRIGALVLTVLNVVLASVFVGTMLLVVEGNWGADCLGAFFGGAGRSLSDLPGFSMGSGVYLMSATFVLGLVGSIVHCVDKSNNTANTEGYETLSVVERSYPQTSPLTAGAAQNGNYNTMEKVVE